LSNADIAAGREAAARLLAIPSPQVGATESWTGPTSGNTGTLVIERIYTQKGNDCRAVRSTVQYRQGGRSRSFLLHTCHVSGKWRLTS
jgi:surface antigen